MVWLTDMLGGGKATADDLARVRDALLFDRGNVRDKYSVFFLMIFLSSVIATGGIVADSTAVVVGAMIIAPLMTPMLAAALSTITGDGRNTVRSLIVTVGGAALVVGVAALVTWLAPTGVQLAGNTQVAARTAPRLIDLVIALAAGAAGAFAIARKDISAVLPGVAVSISLVPPLCVAGTAFAEGAPALALGALLLFATNFFAIQLAGGIVFAMTGFATVPHEAADAHARNVGIAVVVVSTLLLLVPLAAASGQLVRSATLERQANGAVSTWLANSAFEALSVTVKDMVVTVQITGTGVPPETARLAEMLSAGDPRPSKVRVLFLPQELTQATAFQPAGPAVSSSEATIPLPGVAATSTTSVATSGAAAPTTGTAPATGSPPAIP